MKKAILLLALGMLTFAAPIAMAGSVTIDLAGSWANAQINDPNYAEFIKYVPGSNTISWGKASYDTGDTSSYTWITQGAAAGSGKIVADYTEEGENHVPFRLGTFTHHNAGISGGSGIESVQLVLDFGTLWNLNGSQYLTLDLDIIHNETGSGDWVDGTWYENQPDVVTINEAIFNVPITVYNNEDRYYFTLLGFSQNGGNDFKYKYVTEENADTATTLWAIITREEVECPNCEPSEIPEPGTFVLLGTGFVGLVLAARRKLNK